MVTILIPRARCRSPERRASASIRSSDGLMSRLSASSLSRPGRTSHRSLRPLACPCRRTACATPPDRPGERTARVGAFAIPPTDRSRRTSSAAAASARRDRRSRDPSCRRSTPRKRCSGHRATTWRTPARHPAASTAGDRCRRSCRPVDGCDGDCLELGSSLVTTQRRVVSNVRRPVGAAHVRISAEPALVERTHLAAVGPHYVRELAASVGHVEGHPVSLWRGPRAELAAGGCGESDRVVSGQHRRARCRELPRRADWKKMLRPSADHRPRWSRTLPDVSWIPISVRPPPASTAEHSRGDSCSPP